MTGPSCRLRHTLPRKRRLRRKLEFDTMHARGRRLGNEFFGLIWRANESDGPRLGLAVSVKVAGSGVERNRIRRAVRESFRLHQHDLPAVDVVVSARPRIRGAANGELRASLQALWNEVTKQCAILRKP
jgi:ribonuclease P protein component